MNTSKVLSTATFFVTAANGASVPFADIFEALAAPAAKLTPESLTAMLPKSKEESPYVKENQLGGRGWDAAWSTWVEGDKEKWNTGVVFSFDTELSLSWTAPLWSEYIEGYETEYPMIHFEPTFNLDMGAYSKVAFHLYWIEFEFSVDLVPYRFRPFDFSFKIDPWHPRRYCLGFDYMTKGLALEIFF